DIWLKLRRTTRLASGTRSPSQVPLPPPPAEPPLPVPGLLVSPPPAGWPASPMRPEQPLAIMLTRTRVLRVIWGPPNRHPASAPCSGGGGDGPRKEVKKMGAGPGHVG